MTNYSGARSGAIYPQDPRLATPWIRLGARIIDAILLVFVFGLLIGGAILGTDPSGGALIGVGLVLSLAALAYEVLMVAQFGGTVGKLALGLQVVKADTGAKCDLNGALMRALPSAIGAFPARGALGSLVGLVNLVIGVLSIYWIFTDDRRQTVNDRLGQTCVIKK